MYSSSSSDLLLSIVFVVLGVVLLLVIVPSPEEKASWQQREFSTSAESAVTAAISYLQDLGYAIDTIDRPSGFVKTQYVGRGQLQGALGVIVDILAGEARYYATVQVVAMGESFCRVRVNLVAEQWNEGSLFVTGHWSQDSLAYVKSDYDEFFRGLAQKFSLSIETPLATEGFLLQAVHA